MYIAIGKNTPISVIWQHTDHLYYGLFSLWIYNPLVHNWDLTSCNINQEIKLHFFKTFYLISARAVSGQNTCQDCWPLFLFIYKARLMIPGWEEGLMNEWDIRWRQNARKTNNNLMSKNQNINIDYIKYSLWSITRGIVMLQKWLGLL